MPIAPAVAAAMISTAGTGINAASTGNANRRNREHQRSMYEQQFQDNVSFWNMQNEYNDPAAQMQRMKDAGLNPHGQYGNATTGNAGSIQTPDVQPYTHKAADYGALAGIGRSLIHDIADLDIKQAQADNLKTDNTNKIKQGLLLDVQTKQQDYDYRFEKKLEQVNSDIRRQTLLDSQAKTKFTLDKNEREAVMQAQNLQKGVEEILLLQLRQANTNAERQKIKEEINGVRKSNELKQLEIDLKKMGIEKGDPWYFRVLARLGKSGLIQAGSREKMFGKNGIRN